MAVPPGLNCGFIQVDEETGIPYDVISDSLFVINAMDRYIVLNLHY